MKLYISPGACSLSPHIVLLESGLPFTTERVDMGSKRTESGADFKALNPKGYVPALETDDGALLTEGPVIVQYLADLVPKLHLAPPAGSMARYQLMAQLNYLSSELHKTYGPLFRPDASAEVKDYARANLALRYDQIDTMLDGQDYLGGASFSVSDAYLFTLTTWAPYLHFDLSRWPRVQAFQQRVAARPAVQQALRDEGLLS